MNWVAVKHAYGLMTDANEQYAIDEILPPENDAEPEYLQGYKFAQPAPGMPSTAMFGIGLSQNDDCGYVDTARVSDDVRITGIIRPEAAHIGQQVDIYFIDHRVNMDFTMCTEAGAFGRGMEG